ncbi:MAG: S4 domain-containing protein [Flavobacteriales bacterium]|nr:S4 domain-containing protein [Flavobacteriales bacterium]
MPQSSPRPKLVIRRWIAEIEAPLHALLRSELGLGSTTAARNLIRGGAVRVSDEVVKVPSTVVKVGQEISTPETKEGRKLESAAAPTSIRPADDLPFEILYEDEDLICYLKPAGWVAASPNPRVDTSFTRVKMFLIARDLEAGKPERPVHFVNMLDKDSSGIAVVVRDLGLRRRLQENWSEFRFESYLLLRGEIPEDGEFSARRKPDEKYSGKKFPFRRMRSGGRFTILKVQAGLQDIPDILPGLRHHDCMVCGLGQDAPDPLGRQGVHLFRAVMTDDILDAMWEVKTRMPKEFLRVVK